MIDTEPQRLLRLGLGLRKPDAEMEAAWVRALPGAFKDCDELLLAVPSYWEAPNASEHELVQSVIDICRGHAVKVDWGRRLFVTWDVDTSRPQAPGDWCDPAYYAVTLARIKEEAKSIGADSFINCEPHGDKTETEWFKKPGFTPDQRERVEDAVRQAISLTGKVDYAYPAGSANPKHFSWPMHCMGIEGLQSKTYEVMNPDSVQITPPEGYAREVVWWGVLLGGSGLTVQQYRALDWPAIKVAWPECKGFWLMPHPKYRLKLLQALGEDR